MNPTTQQPEPLSPFRPPVAAPVIAEQTHEELGEALAQALLPVFVYCEEQEAKEWPTPWQAARVDEIRNAIEALVSYNGQTEELLAYYRTALGTAHTQLAGQVLALEQALGIDWHSIALRLLARLHRYEPALVLACRNVAAQQPRGPLDWEATAFRLLDRLHRHEPPPAPSQLVTTVRQALASRALLSRAARPLDERRALSAITSHSLPRHD